MKNYLVDNVQIRFCFTGGFELPVKGISVATSLPHFPVHINSVDQSFSEISQGCILITYMLVIPNVFRATFYKNTLYLQSPLITVFRVIIMLYTLCGSLVSSIFRIFNQYLILSYFAFTERGKRSVSPYTITFGVREDTFK